MHLHGLSRSKELVDVFHRVGACISYASVLGAWAVHDLQHCSDFPDEIAEDRTGVIIVDNDDFKNDREKHITSHECNVHTASLPRKPWSSVGYKCQNLIIHPERDNNRDADQWSLHHFKVRRTTSQ